MPPYTRRPQQTTPYAARDGGEERLLTANWGSIAVVLCTLPWVALFTLNPISFFFICFWVSFAWFVTFVPKVLYVLLLELAIIQKRGREFLLQEQKRVRATFPPFSVSLRYVELTVMELGSWFGGMDILKDFRDTSAPIEPSAARIVVLPLTIFNEAKAHVYGFAKDIKYRVFSFLALNVVAKLYTRHEPGTAQVSTR